MHRRNRSLWRALVVSACLSSVLLSGAWAEEAAAVRFAVTGYRVSGNRLVSEAQIAAAVAPFIGTDRDFDDIQKAVSAIRAAYAEKGYRGVAVTLPEQELDSGQVRIVVTELTLEKVEVSGNRHFDGERIRASLPMLVEGQPLNFDNLGRALDVMNENPALKLAVELSGGSTAATRVAHIAVADEEPRDYFVGVDNSGTAATGKHRVTAGVRHADVAGLGHVLTAQYTVSAEKPSDVSFWGLGYRWPLPGDGMTLDLYAGRSKANSGTVANLFDVSGKGTIGGLKLTRQLDRAGALRQRIAAGLDYRGFGNSVVPVGGDGRSIVPDYTVHPVVASYAADFGNANAAVSLSRGFPGGAKADSATLALARVGADAHYTVLRLVGSYFQPLAAGWSVSLGAEMQQTRDALVPGEQFGLGGARSVRGFDERQLAGDSGQRVSLEVYTPQAEFGDLRCKGLGFLDWGELRRNEVQAGEVARESVAAWGLGLRVGLTKQLALAVDAAHVLRGIASRPAGGGRVHLSLQFTF
jgi:hemolysin activation/secretion protein